MSVIKVDYQKLKDAELVNIMNTRGMRTPLNEEGRVMRPEAIRMLKEKDQSEVDENDRVFVIFHDSGNPSAGPYVYANINDKNFQCPYEKKVSIPRYFLPECIDRAIITTYTQQKQADGTYASIPRFTPLYPYSVLGPDTRNSDTPVEE